MPSLIKLIFLIPISVLLSLFATNLLRHKLGKTAAKSVTPNLDDDTVFGVRSLMATSQDDSLATTPTNCSGLSQGLLHVCTTPRQAGHPQTLPLHDVLGHDTAFALLGSNSSESGLVTMVGKIYDATDDNLDEAHIFATYPGSIGMAVTTSLPGSFVTIKDWAMVANHENPHNADIYYQITPNNGTGTSVPTILVNHASVTSDLCCSTYAVQELHNGNFALVWLKYIATTSYYDRFLMFNTYGINGNSKSVVTTITDRINPRNCQIVELPNGNIIFAVQTTVQGGLYGLTYEISPTTTTRVNSFGILVGFNSFDDFVLGGYQITLTQNGDALRISWSAYRSQTQNGQTLIDTGLFSRLFTLTGTPLTPPYEVASAIQSQGATDSVYYLAHTDLKNGILFTWCWRENIYVNSKIRGQRFFTYNLVETPASFTLADTPYNINEYSIATLRGAKNKRTALTFTDTNNHVNAQIFAPPILCTDYFVVTRGDFLTITQPILWAHDLFWQEVDLQFLIAQVTHGSFVLSGNNIPITMFQASDIRAAQVRFQHDGTPYTPTITIIASNFIYHSAAQNVTVILLPPLQPLSSVPTVVNNGISLTQGDTITLDSRMLSAQYDGNQLMVIVLQISGLEHSFFDRIGNPNAKITIFAQQQIQDKSIQLHHDGSKNPPGYWVTATYANTTSVPSHVTVDFHLAKKPQPQPDPAIPEEEQDDSLQHKVIGAIIGGGVSGGIGILFLIIRLYLSFKAQRLLDSSITANSPVMREQHNFDANTLRPIAKAITQKVQITGCMGYISASEMQNFVGAIVTILTHVEQLGTDINLEEMGTLARARFLNIFARETRRVLNLDSKCCGYAARFFKPEASAQDLDDHAQDIAQAIHDALRRPVPAAGAAAEGAGVANLNEDAGAGDALLVHVAAPA